MTEYFHYPHPDGSILVQDNYVEGSDRRGNWLYIEVTDDEQEVKHGFLGDPRVTSSACMELPRARVEALRDWLTEWLDAPR